MYKKTTKTFLKHYYKTIQSICYRFFGHNKFIKKGANNHIRLSRYVLFHNCKIFITGSNNTIIFDEGCTLHGLNIFVYGVGNLISFGRNVVVNASPVQPTVINCVGGVKL